MKVKWNVCSPSIPSSHPNPDINVSMRIKMNPTYVGWSPEHTILSVKTAHSALNRNWEDPICVKQPPSMLSSGKSQGDLCTSGKFCMERGCNARAIAWATKCVKCPTMHSSVTIWKILLGPGIEIVVLQGRRPETEGEPQARAYFFWKCTTNFLKVNLTSHAWKQQIKKRWSKGSEGRSRSDGSSPNQDTVIKCAARGECLVFRWMMIMFMLICKWVPYI